MRLLTDKSPTVRHLPQPSLHRRSSATRVWDIKNKPLTTAYPGTKPLTFTIPTAACPGPSNPVPVPHPAQQHPAAPLCPRLLEEIRPFHVLWQRQVCLQVLWKLPPDKVDRRHVIIESHLPCIPVDRAP